jgi:hypothetical protein
MITFFILAALHWVHASRQREVCSSHPRTSQGRNRFLMFFMREIQNFQVLKVLSSEMDVAEINKK